ncbi:MAG TPA: aspartyl protease family protein [Fimbriimonas sp.]|nr:aspartyl protease family protein [Fimbriimonas sp.]
MTSLFLAVACLPLQAPTVDAIARAVELNKLIGLREDIVIEGKSRAYAVDGTYLLRIGPGGKFLLDMRSALGRKIGFDGRRVWEADRTGATRVLSFGEADTQLVQGALITNSWLKKGAGDVNLDADGKTLNVKLKGSEIEQAVQIGANAMPKLMTYTGAAGKVEVDLDNWSTTPAGKLPLKLTWKEGGVEQTLDGTTVRAEPTKPSAFEMPQWTAKDTIFDKAKSESVETKRLPSGHIIVKPLINGKDVGWFIFDSGADGMCIDTGAANELGLMQIGEVPAVGIGGVVKTPFRSVKEFTLGPTTIKNLMFVQLDLADISKVIKLKLGGIVGYEVFRRSVVEMDVLKPLVSLYDPAAYRTPQKWTPIRFDGGNFAVEALFEGGRKGWFRFDTGAAGTVAFHGPFVEKLKLLEGREVQKTMEGGVGGMREARRGKIAYFELAGHRFENPIANFSISKDGAFHNHWLVGNIGQVFMEPFVLVFDYPNSRMALVPRK